MKINQMFWKFRKQNECIKFLLKINYKGRDDRYCEYYLSDIAAMRCTHSIEELLIYVTLT